MVHLAPATGVSPAAAVTYVPAFTDREIGFFLRLGSFFVWLFVFDSRAWWCIDCPSSPEMSQLQAATAQPSKLSQKSNRVGVGGCGTANTTDGSGS